MIPKGLFTQIGMIIIAVAIAFTYIIPTLDGIGEIQAEIVTYEDELQNIERVNQRLDELVSQMRNVSTEDRQRLQKYLPNEVDFVEVQKDIMNIIEMTGAFYVSSDYDDPESDRPAVDLEKAGLPIEHGFSLSVEGSYDQIKQMFALLEFSDYPLETRSVSIDKITDSYLAAQVEIYTYSYNNPSNN